MNAEYCVICESETRDGCCAICLRSPLCASCLAYTPILPLQVYYDLPGPQVCTDCTETAQAMCSLAARQHAKLTPLPLP